MADRPFKFINGEIWVDYKTAAVICNVTPQTFTSWIRNDSPPPPHDPVMNLCPLRQLGEWVRKEQTLKVGRGRARPYLPDLSRLETHASAQGPSTGETVEGRLKRLQGDKIEMELRERAGELVEADGVKEAMGTVVSNVKTHLLGIAPKVAPLVAEKSDRYTCQEIIADAVTLALEELSSAE